MRTLQQRSGTILISQASLRNRDAVLVSVLNPLMAERYTNSERTENETPRIVRIAAATGVGSRAGPMDPCTVFPARTARRNRGRKTPILVAAEALLNVHSLSCVSIEYCAFLNRFWREGRWRRFARRSRREVACHPIPR